MPKLSNRAQIGEDLGLENRVRPVSLSAPAFFSSLVSFLWVSVYFATPSVSTQSEVHTNVKHAYASLCGPFPISSQRNCMSDGTPFIRFKNNDK